MWALRLLDEKPDNNWQEQAQADKQRNRGVQVVLSLALGLSAFLAFCTLRPRWRNLYGARKRQRNAASRLPELPDSFFGWIPIIYNISDREILASAGLDAYAFLTFFTYAIKYLTITLFFSVVIILPVNYKYTGDTGTGMPDLPLDNGTTNDTSYPGQREQPLLHFAKDNSTQDRNPFSPGNQPYLWMYIIFVYAFTALAIYLLVKTTTEIIRIRQGYLASQSTVTDRTLRLSGIPEDMRSEEKIRDFMEELNIGKVDSIMLCKNWKSLDKMIAERMSCLRRLEEAWTVHLGFRRIERNSGSLPIVQPSPPAPDVNDSEDGDGEQDGLLSGTHMDSGHRRPYAQDRPTTRVWFGPFNLQHHKVDAIDYYEERLRRLDEKIKSARQKEFKPTPLAFVTMESTAACQMAVRAILDPTPGQLLASLAPPPADVVWQNTYIPRSTRMFRSWGIMFLIGFLTVFWAFTLAPLATLLNVDAIEEILPGFAAILERHPIVESLVTTGLPTLGLSLLTIAVPYLYDWLSNMQGMTSQGDIELSVISKNFFFVFCNLFLVFTVFATVSNFYAFWTRLRDVLTDTSSVANALARSLSNLAPFYENFIVLQGLALFPFRLLEFGAVAMYPFLLIGAKTPRDYAELVEPPVFSYGFYLPQTILIFNICTIYSVLPSSWLVTLYGLIYFCIGRFVYKYQLLYAMDHQQHSTGRAWPMICNRIMVGLVVFQIAMIGYLALNKALTRSILLVPALAATVWFNVYFQRTYEPLMKYIALSSIYRSDQIDLPTPVEPRWHHETNQGRLVDTGSETGMRYINPSVSAPLEELLVDKRVALP